MMRRTVFVLFILLFPLQTHAYRVPDREYWQTYTLQLINQSRQGFGLPPLGLDQKMNELSETHAQDTAVHFDDSTEATRHSSYLAHDSSDGRHFADRIRDHQIDGIEAGGENVGFHYRGPIEEIHDMVKKSIDLLHAGMMAEVPPDDGHRKTILGDYTHVGVGLEFHKDMSKNINTLFFVTDFGKFGTGKFKSIPTLGPAPEPIYTADLRNGTVETPPVNEPPRQVPTRTPTTSSWAEQNRLRTEARRSERLARLMERVEERRQARLRR